MAYAVLRFETRKQVLRPLLEHYDGTRRPDHVRELPKGVKAVYPVSTGARRTVRRTADEVAKEARAAATRHRAHRLPGKPPAPLVDVLIAGPPPHTSRDAWDKASIAQWATNSVEWLDARLAVASSKAVVVGAWLHMDERSPHLHLCIIPALDDSTLGWAKVQRAMGEGKRAVSDRVTKAKLSESMVAIQDAYQAEVGARFRLERGKRGSKRKHHRPVHDHAEAVGVVQQQGHGAAVGVQPTVPGR